MDARGAMMAAGLFLAATAAMADTITVGAAADGTLYESATGALANGAGEHMFAGKTQTGLTRRGLVRFDLAGLVPAGSTITSVTLTLNMSKSISGAQDVNLHRVTAAWGEGTSDAGAEEGKGAPSTPGDATWVHRVFPDTLWATPGGDYAATPSAAASVVFLGPYTWSSPAMVADVQAWVDAPATNFGWMLICDESTTTTAKRFDTRENVDPAARPRLTVEFDAPSACFVDCDASGALDIQDFVCFQNGFALGDLTRADCTGDGVLDIQDFICFQNEFALGCK